MFATAYVKLLNRAWVVAGMNTIEQNYKKMLLFLQKSYDVWPALQYLGRQKTVRANRSQL